MPPYCAASSGSAALNSSRAGANLTWGWNLWHDYRRKIDRAGGFKQYEAQVKKSLAAMLVPKFPQIPAEVIPTIVEYWAHAGDY